MSCGEKVDKFTEKLRCKLLRDLAANYDKVQRCYCAHKDRIQSVQENLKYYKRMSYLQTVLIVLSIVVILLLAFLTGFGMGFGLSSAQYRKRPCISTGPFWTTDDCEVSF